MRTFGQPQWRAAVPSDSVPRSIAEAEAHGQRHPRLDDELRYSPTFLQQIDSTRTERRCVNVGIGNGARSGELLAAPFALYAQDWRQGVHPPGKLSFHGGHMRSGVELQLALRFARLDDLAAPSYVYLRPVDVVRRVFAKAWPYGAGAAAVFDLPSRGKWLLVATIDRDWGCFIFDV